MENRNSQHQSIVELARIEIVAPDRSRRVVDGSFRLLTGQTLFLSVNERIPTTTAISVEHQDLLFVGEVAASQKETCSSWAIRVSVKHMLTNLQSLTNLRSTLLAADKCASVYSDEVCVFTPARLR